MLLARRLQGSFLYLIQEERIGSHQLLPSQEPSKPSPINLWLERGRGSSTRDPLLEIAPHIRLKNLTINTTPGYLEDVTKYFAHPASLLETLAIGGSLIYPELNPPPTTTLFDSDLSSLCELRLHSVHTELPWRNMDNITSFTLAHLRSTVSVEQLL